MTQSSPRLPGIKDVLSAAERLRGVANRTPVMSSRTLDERTGCEVFVKCENLQRGGSFKFRGAYNAISRLTPTELRGGVLTYSSGNHGQAVALTCRILGVRTTVVMPLNAPQSKLDATRGYGAEIVQYDPLTSNRDEIAAGIATERGMTVIPPYDHPDVAAGQGTTALELLEEVGPLDLLLVPCGGGGLLSGSALAATSVAGCRVVGVEPELADDAARSFQTGTLQRTLNPPTIADGLRTPSLGEVTWPLVKRYASGVVTVSEAEIVEAMRFVWTRMKLVVEPSGAVALAGLLKRCELRDARRVGVVISGGNVDLTTACALLNSA